MAQNLNELINRLRSNADNMARPKTETVSSNVNKPKPIKVLKTFLVQFIYKQGNGWAYYYEPLCYVDNMLNVYDHITKSNVTLEIYHWGEIGPTGWIDHNTQRAPNDGSSYVPVYFRAKANSSAGGYFQFNTIGHAARVNVKSFQSFGDIDTSINYISSVQAISGGADE